MSERCQFNKYTINFLPYENLGNEVCKYNNNYLYLYVPLIVLIITYLMYHFQSDKYKEDYRNLPRQLDPVNENPSLTRFENYKKEKELNDEEMSLLITFLKDCVDKKKIGRVKDVVYDKTLGLIKEIPILQYNKPTKHFTLKNIDKRISTLKSLAPKKSIQGTIRKKNIIKQDEPDSEEENDI